MLKHLPDPVCELKASSAATMRVSPKVKTRDRETTIVQKTKRILDFATKILSASSERVEGVTETFDRLIEEKNWFAAVAASSQ